MSDIAASVPDRFDSVDFKAQIPWAIILSAPA